MTQNLIDYLAQGADIGVTYKEVYKDCLCESPGLYNLEALEVICTAHS